MSRRRRHAIIDAVQRIALTVAYDGRGFPGWQTQPSRTAIQDVLEAALAAVAGHPVNTVCAGRTDAGVHALAQIVHFDAHAERPEGAWVRGTNAHLPPAVAVQSATRVRADFHARFDAIERHYVYWLGMAPVRQPLWHGRLGWVFRPLDLGRMRAAAALLEGEHDFSAFRSSQCQARSPVRNLRAVQIDAVAPSVLRLRFIADAFLHHMIRNIVGSLVYVGDGRRPVAWLGEILHRRDRRAAAPTFAPDGLYFAGARYPERDPVAAPVIAMPGLSA